MILFIMGLVIGSIGGMIMMAMFLTGKTRDSSFDNHITVHRKLNTVTADEGQDTTKKY